MLGQRHLTFDTIGLAFVHAVHASTASSTPLFPYTPLSFFRA